MQSLNNITNLETTILSIIGFITSIITPFIIKMIRSKDFRIYIIDAIKSLINHFSDKGLFSHYLFTMGKLYIVIAQNTIFKNACKKKEDLFRILLTTKINIVLTETTKWLIKNPNAKLKKLNVIDLQIEFHTLLKNIINKYEKEIVEAFFLYLRNEDEAKDKFDIIYYDKGKGIGFKEYHDRNINHITDFINELPTYVGMNNTWIVSSFLSELDTALRTAVRDVKIIFESKNGSLC